MAVAAVAKLAELQVGEIRIGRVVNAVAFGLFVELGQELVGLLHESELASGTTEDAVDGMQIGDEIKVYVLHVDRVNLKVSLSMRRAVASGLEQPS